MIEFSQRLNALPGYPLAEIPTLKRRLIEAGVDVIDLGAGDNDAPPPAVAIEAMPDDRVRPGIDHRPSPAAKVAARLASQRFGRLGHPERAHAFRTAMEGDDEQVH